MRHIIALCGTRRSGKDTCANIICDEFKGFEHRKIAAPLKAMCKSIFGFSIKQMENDDKELIDDRWGVSPRQAMQFIGTEMFQYKLGELLPHIGRTFWIRQATSSLLLNNISNVRNSEPKHFVFSDLRFNHEVEYLKEFCHVNNIRVHFVRIVRSGVPPLDTNSPSIDEHSSERECLSIPVCAEITNDHTNPKGHDILREQVVNMVNSVILNTT